MDAKLTNPDLTSFIDIQVKSGRFRSIDEAVQEAVARMMHDEHLGEMTDDVHVAIDAGEDSVERGDVQDWKTASQELRRKYLAK